jgi:hypothetical protein
MALRFPRSAIKSVMCLLASERELYDMVARQQRVGLGVALTRDLLRRNILIQAEEVLGIVV